MTERDFQIRKFSRHPDNYFHAEILINGTATYVHCQHGSWMTPGTQNGKTVLREILSPYRDALAAKARAFKKAAQRRLEERVETARKEAHAALAFGYTREQTERAISVRNDLTADTAHRIVAEAGKKAK